MDKDNGGKSIEDMAKEKVFEGVTLNLADMQRQDGIITEWLDKSKNRNLGVIQTVINAVDDDKNYRQILKLGLWKNTEEQDKAVNALAVCRLTGAKNAMRTILDRITARSAGVNGELIHEAFEALTHTTFTTNSMLEKKKRYEDYGDRSRSRLET